MTSAIYVPIVKGKENDLLGLGHVWKAERALIKPFVDVPGIAKNDSTDAHIVRFCKYFKGSFPLGEAFVDFSGLMPDSTTSDGVNSVVSGFRYLKGIGRSVTPAYGFERNDDIWPSLGDIAQGMASGFCFRISRDDLESYSADEVWQQVIERTAQLGLKSSEIDILIDLRAILEGQEVVLQDLVTDFLAANPKAAEYRNVVLAGSSALRDVSSVSKHGTKAVKRSELHLWSHLWRDLPESLQPIYSDYGVVHPDFAASGPNENMNAKVRYTVGDKIIYYRGHGLLKPVKDFDQYHQLASKVCSDTWYLGRPYSYGDKHLRDCADEYVNPGAPATWVKVDMNHHLTYATRQMAALRSKLLHIASESEAIAAIQLAIA